MGFLKQLVDSLNYREIEGRLEKGMPEDGQITEMHFYHSLVVIQKGINLEPASNDFSSGP